MKTTNETSVRSMLAKVCARFVELGEEATVKYPGYISVGSRVIGTVWDAVGNSKHA